MPRKRKPEQPVKEADTTATTMTVEPPIETPAEHYQSSRHLPNRYRPSASRATANFCRPTWREKQPGPDAGPFVLPWTMRPVYAYLRTGRHRVMAIKFDEKPAQPVIDMVKEAGFRWNPSDGVWTHPVRGDSAMATRIDAERLYQEVRQMIRQGKGVETGKDIPF